MSDEPTCDDPLTIAATAAVRRTCVLPRGHSGYCKSADGRAWQTGTGNNDPQPAVAEQPDPRTVPNHRERRPT